MLNAIEFMSMMVSHHVGEVEQFRDHVRRFADLRANDVEAHAREFPSYGNLANDDLGELGRIVELGSQFVVVALCGVVERQRSRILQFGIADGATIDLHQFDNANKFAKSRYQVDLDGIEHAAAIKELRMLSNAIKHFERVTPQLATFPGWTLDDELGDVTNAYDRLRSCVEPYLVGIARRISATPGPTTR